MIKITILFERIIEFTNTDTNAVYEAYVNEKYYEKLDVNDYNPFTINELLNAKSISFKKIKFKEYLLKNIITKL